MACVDDVCVYAGICDINVCMQDVRIMNVCVYVLRVSTCVDDGCAHVEFVYEVCVCAERVYVVCVYDVCTYLVCVCWSVCV